MQCKVCGKDLDTPIPYCPEHAPKQEPPRYRICYSELGGNCGICTHNKDWNGICELYPDFTIEDQGVCNAYE